MVNGPTAEEKRRGCDWTVDEPGRTTLQNPLRTELLRGGGEAQEGFKEVKAGCPDRDFFGRNDAEAETPVLWPPDVKS